MNVPEQKEEIEVEEEISETYVMSAEKLNSLRERANRIRKQCIPSDKFITNVFTETFDAGIFEVFNSIFAETEITSSTVERYKSPWEQMRKLLGDTNLEASPFQPSIPKYYAKGEYSEDSINELLNYEDKSERQTKYTHPIKITFGPKSCIIIEKFTVYWLNHEEVIVQLQVNTQNVMYCDTFVTRTMYYFKQLNERKCLLEYSMFVDFLKSTMFKGTILKSSTDEVTATGRQKLLPAIKENLKYFANQKPPPSTRIIKMKKIIKRKALLEKAASNQTIHAFPSENLSVLNPIVEDFRKEDDIVRVSKEEIDIFEEKINMEREPVKKDNELLDRIISLEKKQETLSQEVRILRIALIIAVSINFIGFTFWFR